MCIANARTYEEQIFKILDPDQDPGGVQFQLDGQMKAADLIQLAAKHTVARMLERDDFSTSATAAASRSPSTSSSTR
jgi:tyrosyl-tRNA synthetase